LLQDINASDAFSSKIWTSFISTTAHLFLEKKHPDDLSQPLNIPSFPVITNLGTKPSLAWGLPSAARVGFIKS
jgi:hypothetical protein